MGSSGSATTTSTFTPPAEVLQNYNYVTSLAKQAALRPFVPYGGEMVAQLTPTQQAGIANVNQAVGTAAPYYQQAANYSLAGAQPLYQSGVPLNMPQTAGLGQMYGYANAALPAYGEAMAGTRQAYMGYSPQGYQQGVGQYMSPYMSQVVAGTMNQLANQQAQQRSALQGSAIGAGAYGGDRAKIAQAELINQQNLAAGQTLGNLLQAGYGQAAQNYMAGLGQQGALAAQMGQLGAGAQAAGLAGAQALYGAGQTQQQLDYQAQQANRAAQQAAAQQMGQLGTGAQAAALQGAQAQLAAGAQQQATQQALDQAYYNQFLQSQAYPFQTTQYLANITQGIGAGSGGTSATTQPGPSAGSQIFGALGALSLLSDPRAKENMEPVGETYDGQKIYKFNYKGDPRTQIGLNAAEVEHHKPEAVHKTIDGIRGVDYHVATQDAADKGHFAAGGVASMGGAVHEGMDRQPFAEGGTLGDIPYLDFISGLSRVPSGKIGGLKSTIPGAPKGYEDTSMQDVMDRINKIKGFGKSGSGLFGSSGLFGPGGLFGGEFAAGGVVGERSAFRDGDYVSPDDPNAFTSDTDLASRIASALGAIESGQDFSAVGPTTKSGDKAYGFSQVMGANIPKWTKEYYGKELTPEDYLKNPQAQVAVTRGHIGNLIKSGYEPKDVASIWFTGRPREQAGNVSDITGTTVDKYLSNFDRAFGTQQAGLDAGKSQDEGSMSFLESALGRRLDPDVKMALLTGALGTMASSSPFFGVAVGQGGLGAIANYVQQKQAEREYGLAQQKMGLEQQKTAAEVAEKGAITKKYTAELYQKVWVPGYGFMLYDNSNPTAPPKRLTDEKMQPLPGVKVSPNDIPTKGPEPAPAPASAEPGGSTSAPVTETPATSKGETVPTPLPAWTPKTSVPEGYVPNEHINIVLNPELKKSEGETGNKMVAEMRDRALAADNQLYRLSVMDENYSSLPKSGFLAPGTHATERLSWAKGANTYLQAIGAKPMFDTSNVAALEELVKDKFRLGAELSRSIGGREPGFIVEQSVQANPGADSSALGYKRITEGLRAAAQYDKDRSAFFSQYQGKFGHLNGAQELFDQMNPPEKYAQTAIVRTVEPKHAEQLKNYIAQYADNKEAVKAAMDEFDKHYGKGVSQLVVGGL